LSRESSWAEKMAPWLPEKPSLPWL